MCYTMHTGAVAAALLAPSRQSDPPGHPAAASTRTCLVGTLSYSDPETGSHFWYPISSGAEKVEGGWKVRKKASWTTSGGFADWYIMQTTSPDFAGNYRRPLLLADHGQRGRRPSPRNGTASACAATSRARSKSTTSSSRPTAWSGPKGDGASSNDECVDPFFLLCSSACWNGISLGLIDIAKRHTTMKKHVDVGMRVADYPTIQDYVGEAIIDTNACRAFVFLMAKAMDDGDQQLRLVDPQGPDQALPRAQYLHWMWQVKFNAAKNVAHVADKMLHACGGTGYKPGLGIERYLRDGKAGWVMGPTNEVLRQFIGKAALLGFAVARLLEPVDERARAQQRAEEARRGRQAGAGREAAEGGGGQGGGVNPLARAGERAARLATTLILPSLTRRVPPSPASGRGLDLSRLRERSASAEHEPGEGGAALSALPGRGVLPRRHRR